jgi:hypothetical protein
MCGSNHVRFSRAETKYFVGATEIPLNQIREVSQVEYARLFPHRKDGYTLKSGARREKLDDRAFWTDAKLRDHYTKSAEEYLDSPARIWDKMRREIAAAGGTNAWVQQQVENWPRWVGGQKFLVTASSPAQAIDRVVKWERKEKQTMCGAKCRGARGPACDCICEGQFHGVSVGMSRARFAADHRLQELLSGLPEHERRDVLEHGYGVYEVELHMPDIGMNHYQTVAARDKQDAIRYGKTIAKVRGFKVAKVSAKKLHSRSRFAAEDLDLRPTAEMAANAERGLALREEHGKGGTAVGVARARDIKNRANLSPDTVKRMHSFFSRHEGNQKGGEDDAGYIAWLLWGGDAGKAWAARKAAQMDKDTNMKTKVDAKSRFAINIAKIERLWADYFRPLDEHQREALREVAAKINHIEGVVLHDMELRRRKIQHHLDIATSMISQGSTPSDVLRDLIRFEHNLRSFSRPGTKSAFEKSDDYARELMKNARKAGFALDDIGSRERLKESIQRHQFYTDRIRRAQAEFRVAFREDFGINADPEVIRDLNAVVDRAIADSQRNPKKAAADLRAWADGITSMWMHHDHGKRTALAARQIAMQMANLASSGFARKATPNKDLFSMDMQSKLMDLTRRFGFKPSRVIVRGTHGTILFEDQPGEATRYKQKLAPVMKAMGIPDSAIKAREVSYPEEDGEPATHTGVVEIDYAVLANVKASRTGEKSTHAAEVIQKLSGGWVIERDGGVLYLAKGAEAIPVPSVEKAIELHKASSEGRLVRRTGGFMSRPGAKAAFDRRIELDHWTSPKGTRYIAGISVSGDGLGFQPFVTATYADGGDQLMSMNTPTLKSEKGARKWLANYLAKNYSRTGSFSRPGAKAAFSVDSRIEVLRQKVQTYIAKGGSWQGLDKPEGLAKLVGDIINGSFRPTDTGMDNVESRLRKYHGMNFSRPGAKSAFAANNVDLWNYFARSDFIMVKQNPTELANYERFAKKALSMADFTPPARQGDGPSLHQMAKEALADIAKYKETVYRHKNRAPWDTYGRPGASEAFALGRVSTAATPQADEALTALAAKVGREHTVSLFKRWAEGKAAMSRGDGKASFSGGNYYTVAAHIASDPAGERNFQDLAEAKAYAKVMLDAAKSRAKGKPVVVDVYPVVNYSPQAAVMTLKA